MEKPTVIISVSELSLLFGIWKDKLPDYKNKNIVVLNRRNHKVVGALQIIEPPMPLESKCPCCFGTGKIELKIHNK